MDKLEAAEEIITQKALDELKYDENFFGNWTKNLDEIKESFNHAKPYSHVVIDNFLNDDIANRLSDTFPKPNKDWWYFHNPIEEKFIYDKLHLMDEDFRNYFFMISKPEFLEKMKKISGIDNLEIDPYFHGGGMHCHPPGGKLNMHLDYSINPKSGKERRINIIYFLNKEWNQDWGGILELWSADMKECKKKLCPGFNRALLFITYDESWHGLPGYVKCPEGLSRNSLAIYYVAEPRKVTLRPKAKFVLRPQDPYDERMQKLLDIRPVRRITEQDLNEIWPGWEKESRAMYDTESVVVE